MTKILFYDQSLSIRGSSRALYDYARYNEEILGNESIIFYNRDCDENNSDIIDVFKGRFDRVLSHGDDSFDASLRRILDQEGDVVFYRISNGFDDLNVPAAVRLCNHVMFGNFDPNGDVYAYVSRRLAKDRTNGAFPWVPHVVDIPTADQSMRQQWSIPGDAFVVGRHGGEQSFDIPFVRERLDELLTLIPDLWFVFVNTDHVLDHPRVVHLAPIADAKAKANFIGSCDAMLHGRLRGETFGLAICEFLALDRPVLAWSGGYDRNHLELLSDHPELLYDDFEQLRDKLIALRMAKYAKGTFRCIVDEFQPMPVMMRFKEVFLDAPSRRHGIGRFKEQAKVAEWKLRHAFFRLRKKAGLA